MRSSLATLAALLLSLNQTAQAKVIDDFDDNKVKGWEKFDFGTGNGYFKEKGGQFTIGMHKPTGQQFFVAATHKAEKFTVTDGVTVEFRVDLIEANQSNAFAVLSFIPSDTPVSKLSGYSVVKDDTDILLAKGLNKYFYDITEGDWLDVPENITLSLTLTGKGRSVEVTTRIYDIENDGALLFEKTVVDTAEAEDLDTGDDSPAASFIDKPGNFALLLYHNDTGGSLPASSITLDNAEVLQYESTTIDDFDDNKVKGWEKFDFGTGNGFFKEKGGQFTIGMHKPTGQQFFVAATHKEKTFTIEDGVTVEFSVDLIEANQSNAFLVLSFIPNETPVSKLSGYSLAKDDTDILLAKGLNKYFYDLTEGDWLDVPDNITLNLILTGRGKSVEVTTRVFDIKNDNALVSEKTVIDTIETEELDTGDDSPAASFINKPGKFVLLLYHNDTGGSLPASSVTVDNARFSVFGASQRNQLPVISDVLPVTSSPFLPASTEILFTVTDDQPFDSGAIQVTLNGVEFTTANGLKVTGEDKSRTVVLGGLRPNQTYHAVLSVEDSEGESETRDLFFDTLEKASFVIEVEDYNFNAGEYLDEPVVIPELDEDNMLNWDDNAYIATEGYLDIDYFDKNEIPQSATHRYRPEDGVSTAPALDLDREPFISAGGKDKGVYDYGIAEIEEGEWLNYTRTFPKGDFIVYLRQAQFSIEKAVATLERVTGATDEEDQTTEVLGSFIGSESGVEYRNVLLTNEDGTEPVVLSLGGKDTLRLVHHTTDANDQYLKQNYLVFVRYEKPTVELQVSDSVQGPYKTDAGASIDEVARTITLGQAGATQFYRLSGVAAKITDIRLADGKVILPYE